MRDAILDIKPWGNNLGVRLPVALHMLPQAGALRDAVRHGATTTLGLTDAQL